MSEALDLRLSAQPPIAPAAWDKMVELIDRKKTGGVLTPAELARICGGLIDGSIPDYQIAAWLMAVYFQGMADSETLALTLAMVASGATLNWSHLAHPPVDKHSTGGVGDKTSMVLVPLMAAIGLPFVKMSGRGLGHTGGTLDKLESIPGFSVRLPLARLRAQVDGIGCALVGQSEDLVPADGLLYALRDVTGTVDSIPLISSSIMSKKLAGGAQAIVLDVKYGSGAFMQEVEEARELARVMVRIGTGAGRRVSAVLSSMEEPLGCAVGNALEVEEVIETLRGEGPEDLWQLTVELGTELLLLTGATTDPGEAVTWLNEHRDSGAALERFGQLVAAQGGDSRIISDRSVLPKAPIVRVFPATSSGTVVSADARGIADAALALGAGRRKKTDTIDPAVGIRMRAKLGSPVDLGDALAEIHARTPSAAEEAAAILERAFGVSLEHAPPKATRHEIIRPGEA